MPLGSRAVAGLFLCVLASACGERAAHGDLTAAPVLVPVDSVQLTEDGGITLGMANSLAVTGRGDFFVGDAGLPKVVHYGRNGQPLGVIGRTGAGPGEYRVPAWLALADERTLLVVNASALEVLAFDTETGRLRWDRTFPVATSSLFADRDHLYFGYVGGSSTGSLGIADMPSVSDSSTAKTPARVASLGPVPSLFNRVPLAATVFGTVELAAIGDTVASVYEVSNYVYLTRVSTGAVDSIEITKGNRRGARTDLFDAVTTDQASAMNAFLKSSIPLELAPLSSGKLAYVAFDAAQENGRIKGDLYLAVVDVAKRRSCADVRIPGSADPPMRVAVRGDTLFTLSQEATPGDSAVVVFRAYRVDTERCRWR